MTTESEEGLLGGHRPERRRSFLELLAFRQRLRKTGRQFFDLALIWVFYFGGGTIFFKLADSDFSWTYAFFYATNVGLGVGYGNLHVRDIFQKWFTVFFMIAGTSVVIGSMSVFFDNLVKRRLVAAGLLYLLAIVYGIILAFEFENSHELVDALLFTVGNYTTAGLIVPRNAGLLWTTLSLLIGVPANFLFFGQVAHHVLRAYENEVEHDPRPSSYVSWLEDQLLKTAAVSPDKLRDIRVSFQG